MRGYISRYSNLGGDQILIPVNLGNVTIKEGSYCLLKEAECTTIVILRDIHKLGNKAVLPKPSLYLKVEKLSHC